MAGLPVVVFAVVSTSVVLLGVLTGFIPATVDEILSVTSLKAGSIAVDGLTATSTTQGLLPPRMTTAQIDAISSPAPGSVVYDTDEDVVKVFDASLWSSMESTRKPLWVGHKETLQTITATAAVHTWVETASVGDWVWSNSSSIDYWSVPRDGVYLVTWDITESVNAFYTWIAVSTTDYTSSALRYGHAYTPLGRISSSCTIAVNTTDEIRVVILHSTGTTPTNLNPNTRPEIGIVFLSAL